MYHYLSFIYQKIEPFGTRFVSKLSLKPQLLNKKEIWTSLRRNLYFLSKKPPIISPFSATFDTYKDIIISERLKKLRWMRARFPFLTPFFQLLRWVMLVSSRIQQHHSKGCDRNLIKVWSEFRESKKNYVAKNDEEKTLSDLFYL